jgi:hypothetical protein
VFDIATAYRQAADYRASQLQCISEQQGSGLPIHCQDLNAVGITDWDSIYLYARKIDASFVRYLPVVMHDDRGVALFDWNDPAQRSAVHWQNQQPLRDDWWQAEADPQFTIALAPGEPAAGQCVALGVRVKLMLERRDTVQLFFRPAGRAQYSESSSVRKSVAPNSAGEAWAAFVLDSSQGFEPELRLDPIDGPGRFRLLGARVTCLLRADP